MQILQSVPYYIKQYKHLVLSALKIYILQTIEKLKKYCHPHSYQQMKFMFLKIV